MNSNRQARRILITAGPAVAPIDQIRRITNHSTGSLSNQLAEIATSRGHHVTLLRSTFCTAPAPTSIARLIDYEDFHQLRKLLELTSKGTDHHAVWHAAAVSDFLVEKVCNETGEVLDSAKLDSRSGNITIHLAPAPKLIHQLRELFPNADIVGWKYEVTGNQSAVLEKAFLQNVRNHIDATVANGPAYGDGFGICSISSQQVDHVISTKELAYALLQRIEHI